MCFRPPTITSERKCPSCGEVCYDADAKECPKCGEMLADDLMPVSSPAGGVPGAAPPAGIGNAPGAPGIPAPGVPAPGSSSNVAPPGQPS